MCFLCNVLNKSAPIRSKMQFLSSRQLTTKCAPNRKSQKVDFLTTPKNKEEESEVEEEEAKCHTQQTTKMSEWGALNMLKFKLEQVRAEELEGKENEAKKEGQQKCCRPQF